MATQPQTIATLDRRSGRANTSRNGGIRQQRIIGGFVKISVHQFIMAAWLYREGHINRQQLRLYLAGFELAERRRHTLADDNDDRQPSYRLQEIQRLVGGSERKIRTNLNRLADLGLMALDRHALSIATSIDQIRIADVSGFWEMFRRVETQHRPIPVPRRTLRAMAHGFGRGETIFMIGILIRCLFFHKKDGDYRIDGRMKLAWLCDVFGISRRAATDARKRLIELGWIEPIDSPQWELNKWGLRHRIVTDWVMPDLTADAEEPSAEHAPESASPPADFAPEFASPYINQKSSLTRTIKKTRRLGAGVSVKTKKTAEASRESRGKAVSSAGMPRLQDIQAGDLASTGTLLALYAQAVDQGLIPDCEAGRLDFCALAERAIRIGHNPGGMFKWLLVNKRYDYITQADEDAAAQRLRSLRDGPAARASLPPIGEGGGGGLEADRPAATSPAKSMPQRSPDDTVVETCLRVVQQLNKRGRRSIDPFDVALQKWQWSRERWDRAYWDYQCRQRERWYGGGR